ncbi:MAG: MBL fold metallo-hydrolase [Actinomycetota bacterium]
MRVTLLGTGGPRPDPVRQGPATLVEADGLSLLFDAGRGVATQLARAGVPIMDLDAVFITHHHFDHIGGLADLLMSMWNLGRTKPLPVVGPHGTGSIVNSMFEHVYARDIAYRITEESHLGRSMGAPSDFIQVTETLDGSTEFSGGVTVRSGRVEHGSSVLGFSAEEWSACGYRVSTERDHVAVSGDAVGGLDLESLAAGADALVMCAYLSEDEIRSEDDRFLSDKIIAGAPQAAGIAATARAERLILTHIREKSDEALERMKAQVSEIFPGEVIIGHDLLSIEIS